ncbi:hypothetical protein LguiA_003913 [Lonicera macranthoides]
MGSIEEEKLFQMVHDFIEESDQSPPLTNNIFCISPHTPPLNHHHRGRFTKSLILQGVLKSGGDAETKVAKSVLKHMKDKMENEKSSGLKKWLVTRLKIDGYNASMCQTSWPTTLSCLSGGYEYIDIKTKDERLIIDIDFKSQFELARPTKAYKNLSDLLPTIFIGDENKLKKIISLLCSAAKQSLNERGLHIPPWRTNNYMQSKWLADCHKIKVDTAGSFSSGEVGGGHPFVSSKFSGGSSNWSPPMVKPKRKDFGGGGSGLSSQFSNMSTECC